MKYNRVLLKLSGEALMGNDNYGINAEIISGYVEQIIRIVKNGTQVGIVIGGGNIFRGMTGTGKGFDRVIGDQMGMMATVINSMALLSAFENNGQKARVFTAFSIESIGERFSKQKATQAMKSGEVAIFSGGTGNPFFTTDSASALRAVEIEADVLLKGTRVDGIYTADPEKDPKAEKFEQISFNETIRLDLKIMDQTAFTMCKENNLPIIVFDMNKAGNLDRIVNGENVGTLVNL
ncbi:MAG: UMP kinase [Bacteroidetes bacterium 4572_117]|nr:MAG: UMP kinase [Bacteroidetes bacterium 4572_117]